jgi:hypothetical protein
VLKKVAKSQFSPWALWLSKVISVFDDAFEAIFPLHHSGVVPVRDMETGILMEKGNQSSHGERPVNQYI